MNMQNALNHPRTGFAVVLFACALQSVTDYPLRNQSMLVLAAFALVLLARAQPGFSADDAGTTRRERTLS